MNIPKGLLIAGGVGALGLGAWMLFKDDAPKEGADPASKDPGAGSTPPTAGTPTGGMPTGGFPVGPGGTPSGAGTGAESAQSGAAQLANPFAGGQQVGAYTVVPDPASGQQMIIETATQQPVGVLDAQGNIHPLAPQGQMQFQPQGQFQPQAQSQGQAQAPNTQYGALAQALFAGAGDPTIGAAQSDAMGGASQLPAAQVQGQAQGAGGVAVVSDPATGTQVVVDTATQQPLGVLDPQGNVIPLDALMGGASPANGAGMQGAAPAGVQPGGGAVPPNGAMPFPAPAGVQ